MKATIFLFFSALLSQVLSAQLPNYAGIGSSHIYTDQDGIDEENFYVAGIASDGRVFVHSHTGSLFVIGNNYYKKIKIPSATSVPPHLGSVIEIGKNRFIAPSNNVVYIIENDSITKWVMNAEPNMGIFKKGDTLVGFRDKNFYLWKNDTFILSYSPGMTNDAINYYYTDSVSNLWELRKFQNKTDFYQIKNFKTAEFQFSIDDSACAGKKILEIKDPKKLFLYSFEAGFHDLSRVHLSLNFSLTTRYFISAANNNYTIMSDRFSDLNIKYYIQHDAMVMSNNCYDSVTNSFYFGTFKKPFRCFQYLKKYPVIFNGNASSINAIAHDSLGRIWAGSFDGGLAIIDRSACTVFTDPELRFLPGSLSTSRHIYMQTEKSITV